MSCSLSVFDHTLGARSTTKKLEDLVKAEKPEATFVVNHVRPSKGTFAVTIDKTELVKLSAMPRPFKKLRELDIDALAKRVIKHVK